MIGLDERRVFHLGVRSVRDTKQLPHGKNLSFGAMSAVLVNQIIHETRALWPGSIGSFLAYPGGRSFMSWWPENTKSQTQRGRQDGGNLIN